LKAYIDYRMGLLQHYGSQISNKKIIQDYFLGKSVLHQNPAYMELFNQVFKDYFIAFSEEHPGLKLPVIINRDKDYTQVNKILTREASFGSDSLRELVLLKGLYDGYYDGKNIPSSMIQLLDSVKHQSFIEIHKQAVNDIMLEITKLLPGYQPPDFALYNSDSTLVRLSDFRGAYVYLNFCNSFGYYCVREFEYLRILRARLKEQISILTILVDDSFESMEELVKSNNYPWTYLHFSNQPDVLEGYDIRAYPSYFLIGPEGKIILSPAPSPAENFESTFLRIYSNQGP
ncbi:MAG: TlpA family protein disulfide reductase, partial [Bacteroidales bacterium]|nr:TlpA family protein disulfide reductase [Bacteroidales bacterium]